MIKFKSGFTLLELLITISIIGLMSAILMTSINPGRQFSKARDAQRETDLIAILSVIYQYASEHSGEIPDTDGNSATSNFPSSLTCIGTASPCYNLGSAGATGETIVPVYVASLPKDPKTGTDANTGYLIKVDTNGHFVASASGETKTITLTR